MASFDDYDEFGNYIGAALDSDDEEQGFQGDFVPGKPQLAEDVQPVHSLEGYEEQLDGREVMEIDGMRRKSIFFTLHFRYLTKSQNRARMLSSFMKTKSIIRPPLKFTEKMSRLWFRRRMLNL
jgi:hypothetical protein